MMGEFDMNDEQSRNMAINQYNNNLVQKAFKKFGNFKGMKSPTRLTQTQTFGKEERGAVHLFYDPDFKDNIDFR